MDQHGIGKFFRRHPRVVLMATGFLLALLEGSTVQWTARALCHVDNPVLAAVLGGRTDRREGIRSAEIIAARGAPQHLTPVFVVAPDSPLVGISLDQARNLASRIRYETEPAGYGSARGWSDRGQDGGVFPYQLLSVGAKDWHQGPEMIERILKLVSRNTNLVGLVLLEETDLRVRILPVDGWHPTKFARESLRYPLHVAGEIRKTEHIGKGLARRIQGLARFEKESIRMVAGGDVIPARGVEIPMAKNGWGVVFTNLQKVFSKADIAFCNWESPISSRGVQNPKAYVFRTPPEALPEIDKLGLDVVSLANNHSLDYGLQALKDTMMFFRWINVAIAGYGTNREMSRSPARVARGGRVFGFSAYSYWHDSDCHFDTGRPGYAIPQADIISNEVAAMKQQVDALVVSLHSGTEYQPVPDPDVVRFARRAIAGGAMAVIGHHPHWFQGYEIYNGKPIFYSLGNLVFDQDWNDDVRSGYLVELGIRNGMVATILVEPFWNSFQTFEPMPQNKRSAFWRTLLERSQMVSRMDR